jgi:hypothetical protein
MSWAGNTHLDFADGGHFSFLEESERIWKAIGKTNPDSPWKCIHEFAAQLHATLQRFCLPDGRLTTDSSRLPKKAIAKMLMVGYFNREPYRSEVIFSHKNLFLLKPEVHGAYCPPPAKDFYIFSGSPRIYRTHFKPLLMEPASLNEAASQIRTYLQACIDNRYSEPECAHIGGHVNVAVVRNPRRT